MTRAQFAKKEHVDDRDHPSTVRPKTDSRRRVKNSAGGALVGAGILVVEMAWIFVVTPLVANWTESRRLKQSVAFRSRWQYVPLWQVPHEELEAEAKRCEAMTTTLEQRLSDNRDPRARAELAGQITWYRSALAAVQQAMAYGAVQGQGQWPQQPPH